ncbi:MAG: class II aldolase/adducin family protein [Acidobacteria bacterium]|jgi:L-fuculose-phosphate aldolase|nr:class II aldolase/adducin family protein [Acidobacteriota bacterium]
MENSRENLINNIVEISHKLHAMGWVANHDGNVTAVFESTLLATPTAVSKADITSGMILTLDKEGNKIQGIGKPFSEINLHLAAYKAREDIRAVVHAHPPFAMARGMVDSGDFEIVVPEAIVSLGDMIPVVGYIFPGSPEHEKYIAESLSRCDVFMMAGNGVLSVGRDIKDAYLRMELLEHLLKIDYYAKFMGQVMTIPAEDKQKLLEKRAAAGLGPKVDRRPAFTGSHDDQKELLKELIAEEIKNILKEKGKN